MATILVVESSARDEGSISRQLTAELIAGWQQQSPDDRIILRDVAAQPLPHLDMDMLCGRMLPPAEQTLAQQAADARCRELAAELLEADVVVLAAPMYNFGVPSTLKAWIDHVLYAGLTFRYTENGPVGLLEGKRGVVISARGGVHAGLARDHVEPYLVQVLNFVGIQDVVCVHAEGLNMGEVAAAEGLASARAALQALHR